MNDLQKIAAEFREAKDKLEDLRPRLAAAIVVAAREGMAQVEIVRLTGYTREHVRQIVRKAGIEG